MKKILFFSFSLFILQQLSAQFRFDNKSYKTVFWDDFCRELQRQNDPLLLDVRSMGEYSDTSVMAGMNIGYLKGAVNIDVRELPNRLTELETYKNKPVFVYCSHSQRSRRASKLLSEKGVTNVININGGMTMYNNLKSSGIVCNPSLYESNIRYELLSPPEVCGLMNSNKEVFVLDVRKDSAFNGISAEEMQNAFGKFRISVNIPLEKLEGSLEKIPMDKTILLVDEQGDESPEAAKLLTDKGYKNVAVLFDGLENWASVDPEQLNCRSMRVTRKKGYGLLNAERFNLLGLKTKDLLIIDVRPDSLFNNKSVYAWRNIGHIKHAINIPDGSLNENLAQTANFKNKPVIIYSFSSSPETFSTARALNEKGYTQVYVLLGGLFHLRWSAANIKDRGYLNDWVVNVPPDNY